MTPASADGEQGVILDENELRLLAKRILADHILHNAEDWLLWEDLPALSEGTFSMLYDTMQGLAAIWLRAGIRLGERAHDIDVAELLEAAQR